MRTFAMATILVGASGLAGCSPAPQDPYSNMRMLTPEEAGAGPARPAEDPVLQEEKDYNARFNHKKN